MTKKRMNKKLKNLLVNLAIVTVIAVIIIIVIAVRNSYSVYDYGHLTRYNDYGVSGEFAPLPNVSKPAELSKEEWEPAADNSILTLFVNVENSNIAVLDKRNGHVWYSCPADSAEDKIANAFEKDVMRSTVGFRYYNERKRRLTRWSYLNAAALGQFQWESIEDGARIIFQVGDLSLGIDACPRFLTEERFEEILELVDESDKRFFSRSVYLPAREKEGFVEMIAGVRTHAINSERIINIFSGIGYTLEDLEEDNAAADYEFEIDKDFFTVEMEFTISGDTLSVNFPISRFRSTSELNRLYYVEIMKYFGAGGNGEEGYLFVPSGSGALIEFNNGKINEEAYIGNVYGLDPLMNMWMPQNISPVRLPVLGIKRENAAVLAYVESGSAMAIVNADVAGRNNSYNTASFSFLVRDYTLMNIEVVNETDNFVIQPYAYEGDITVSYRFLSGGSANYVGMASAYQQTLVDKGDLTPLPPSDDTPFYLDIVGAAEKREFILGTPYSTLAPMTTYKQAGEILDSLNRYGVRSVQMQWYGWFNKGINHIVAKNIKWISSIGSKKDMKELNDRLQSAGGGFYPAVSFNMVNGTYYGLFNGIRGVNTGYEVARDPAGFLGNRSNYKRAFLNYGGGPGMSTWYCLITPGVLPFHLDSFIPKYDRLGLDSIALSDLGDLLTESLYRRNPVDREHGRLIVSEQLSRLDETYGSVMVSGGNDYALGAANHIVNAPVEMDRYYILDHEVPFYQIVVHGFIDYAGLPFNSREVQDVRKSFLNAMATGAALHYQWTYEQSRHLEFTVYETVYSTQYENWIDEAAALYREYNDVHKNLRTQRITGHEILSESSSHITSVTVTEYEDGTRVYVNTTDRPFTAGSVVVPPRGYAVAEGGR